MSRNPLRILLIGGALALVGVGAQAQRPLPGPFAPAPAPKPVPKNFGTDIAGVRQATYSAFNNGGASVYVKVTGVVTSQPSAAAGTGQPAQSGQSATFLIMQHATLTSRVIGGKTYSEAVKVFFGTNFPTPKPKDGDIIEVVGLAKVFILTETSARGANGNEIEIDASGSPASATVKWPGSMTVTGVGTVPTPVTLPNLSSLPTRGTGEAGNAGEFMFSSFLYNAWATIASPTNPVEDATSDALQDVLVTIPAGATYKYNTQPADPNGANGDFYIVDTSNPNRTLRVRLSSAVNPAIPTPLLGGDTGSITGTIQTVRQLRNGRLYTFLMLVPRYQNDLDTSGTNFLADTYISAVSYSPLVPATLTTGNVGGVLYPGQSATINVQTNIGVPNPGETLTASCPNLTAAGFTIVVGGASPNYTVTVTAPAAYPAGFVGSIHAIELRVSKAGVTRGGQALLAVAHPVNNVGEIRYGNLPDNTFLVFPPFYAVKALANGPTAGRTIYTSDANRSAGILLFASVGNTPAYTPGDDIGFDTSAGGAIQLTTFSGERELGIEPASVMSNRGNNAPVAPVAVRAADVALSASSVTSIEPQAMNIMVAGQVLNVPSKIAPATGDTAASTKTFDLYDGSGVVTVFSATNITSGLAVGNNVVATGSAQRLYRNVVSATDATGTATGYEYYQSQVRLASVSGVTAATTGAATVSYPPLETYIGLPFPPATPAANPMIGNPAFFRWNGAAFVPVTAAYQDGYLHSGVSGSFNYTGVTDLETVDRWIPLYDLARAPFTLVGNPYNHALTLDTVSGVATNKTLETDGKTVAPIGTSLVGGVIKRENSVNTTLGNGSSLPVGRGFRLNLLRTGPAALILRP